MLVLFFFVVLIIFMYNVWMEMIIYEYIGREYTNAQYMGAYGPADKYQIQDEDKVVPYGLPKEYVKKTPFLTLEMVLYVALSMIFQATIPGYVTIIMISRALVVLWEFCRVNIERGTKIYNCCVKISLYIMKFWRIGNYVINLINKLNRGWFRIRKSAESLSTYSLATVSIIGLGLFYLLKKFFTKKDEKYPQPHTKQQETRGQAMINLGIMIIAFIGWSDFGMWKKFQDWIRMQKYVNSIFGDAANDTSCRNFDGKKYNINCEGTEKGEHLCLRCTAHKITKEPAVLSRVTLDYSQNSIMENPGIYFYALANSILKSTTDGNQFKIPEWYLRLPRFLQDQIFDSHYAIISDKDHFPDKYRLTHDRLINFDFKIRRDEKIGKWTIVTTEPDVIKDKIKSYKPTTIRTYNNQYVISDSESDSEDYHQARKPHIEEKNLDIKSSPEPHTLPHPHLCSAHGNLNPCELCKESWKLLDEYADAFIHEDEESKETSEAIPLLQHLPKYFKPCVFIAAMCLVLYGSFYYYRKQKLQQQLQEKVISVVATQVVEQAQKELPPVLKDGGVLLSVDPETYQSRMKDTAARKTRHQPRHTRRQEDKEDTSDVVMQKQGPAAVYTQVKKEKQRAYVCYNFDDLITQMTANGVLMINKDGKGTVVRTKAQYIALKEAGYEASPSDLAQIAKGTLNLKNLEYEGPFDFTGFKRVSEKLPLTGKQYRFVVDELDEDQVVPDEKWNNLFKYYSWDPDTRMFLYKFRMESNESKQEPETNIKILKRDKINEIQQQNLELSNPCTLTMDEYERMKKLTEDIIDVSANDKVTTILQNMLTETVIAEPESNIATVKSKECPYGLLCKLKDCFMEHPSNPQPEAMCGVVKIDHYPNNMNTKNAYQIFRAGVIGNHYGMCCYTKLGFITNKHVFFEDRIRFERPIPCNELEVMIEGKRYPILSYEKVPEIHGADNKTLPPVFQDMVVFKISERLDLVPTKTKPPRDGERICIVSANQLTVDEYKQRKLQDLTTVRTQEAVIHKQPNGMYYYRSNNKPGDSGSPIYSLDQGWALVGIYYGRADNDVNTIIPIDGLYLPNFNGGQKFELTKNLKPTA
jgi:hypothetical protein